MNRRNFIISGSAAGAGVLTGVHAFAKRANPSDTLNVGICGAGDRGSGLTRLINNIPGIQVTATSDIIPFRLEYGKEVAGKKAKAYDDYRRLLDDKSVDAVLITLPFSMHYQAVKDAISAGKHIYCEKTMVKGIEEAKDTVKIVESNSQLKFMVGHQYHSSPLYQRVKEIVDSGYIGEIALFDAQWNRNGNWRRPVSDPKWEKMINWRMYREYSGGLAAELCSHQIDFCDWLMDDHPSMVSGFGGIDYYKDGRETYDNVHITMQYKNGVNSRFTSLTTNAFESYQIKIHGKKATIKIDFDKAVIYLERFKEAKEKGLVDGVSGATLKQWEAGEGAMIEVDYGDPTIEALVEFRNVVLNNKSPKSNVRSGAWVSNLIQMSLDAMDTNTVQHWKNSYDI